MDGGAEGGTGKAPAASLPLPSADELARLAEETIRGGHAVRAHDGQAPFSAPLDLAASGCGRVVLVAEQPVIATVLDATGPRGGAVEAGARVLALVPPGGPVCVAAGGSVATPAAPVMLAVTGSGAVRWTTVTR